MIHIESLEIHINEHCNLSCYGCSHMSPIEKEKYININEVLDDLERLKSHLHTNTLRVLGGEPLLNPQISDFCKMIKRIGISDMVSISTNGLLLDKTDDSLWNYVDELEVSIYNYSNNVVKKIIAYLLELSKEKNINVHLYFYDCFRNSFINERRKDTELTQKIYEKCIISNLWQCYNLHDGYLYKCPQAYAIDKLMCRNRIVSGIAVDDFLTGQDIDNYINQDTPLPACEYCLGSAGKKIPIMQVSRHEWSITETNEDAIDEEMLRNDIDDMDTIAFNLTISKGKVNEFEDIEFVRNFIIYIARRCGYPNPEVLNEICVSSNEISIMRMIAKESGITPKRILEIGSYVGCSSILLSYIFPSAAIVCVDPGFPIEIDFDFEFKSDKTTHELFNTIAVFFENIFELKIKREKGFFSVSPGVPMLNLLEKHNIDIRDIPVYNEKEGQLYNIIFIDGDHSLNSVLNDLYKADALLSDNGLIFLHDIACEYKREVLGALELFLSKNDNYEFSCYENLGVLKNNNERLCKE